MLCHLAVYCVLGWFTECLGGVLHVRVVHCVLGRFTVCYGGVLCGRAVCCELE